MITVLGSSGFIGSHVLNRIKQLGLECGAPHREEDLAGRKLGSVIYAIGLTADFRSKPLDAVDAHVCNLLSLMQTCDFDSLLYLSSTRLYTAQAEVVREDDQIVASSLSPDHLYNISKLMGESLAFSLTAPVRVARLANVYGPDYLSENFLSTLIRDAVTQRRIVLRSSPESAKDYVNVDDVADVLIKIATLGREKLYNVASGRSVATAEITAKLQQLTGCTVESLPGVPKHTFPRISIDRIEREFNFKPRHVLDDLEPLVERYKKQFDGS